MNCKVRKLSTDSHPLSLLGNSAIRSNSCEHGSCLPGPQTSRPHQWVMSNIAKWHSSVHKHSANLKAFVLQLWSCLSPGMSRFFATRVPTLPLFYTTLNWTKARSDWCRSPLPSMSCPWSEPDHTSAMFPHNTLPCMGPKAMGQLSMNYSCKTVSQNKHFTWFSWVFDTVMES